MDAEFHFDGARKIVYGVSKFVYGVSKFLTAANSRSIANGFRM